MSEEQLELVPRYCHCGAPIKLVRSHPRSASWIPINPEPDAYEGNILLQVDARTDDEEPIATVLGSDFQRELHLSRGAELYRAHRHTCPDPERQRERFE